jgi:GNAT superfamily N-acetyltransferase
MLQKWPPEFLQNLESLLDESFQVQGYISSFPHVFSRENTQWWSPHFVDNELVSFCAGWPLSWETQHETHQNRTWRGLCLGSVCTRKQSRGQGFARKAILALVERAVEDSMDFVCLFAQEPQFYLDLGFDFCSRDRFALWKNQARALDVASPNSSPNKSELLSQGDAASLLQQPLLCEAFWHLLNLEKTDTLSVLSFEEWRLLLTIGQMRYYGLCVENHWKSFVLQGKGADFGATFHALAGESGFWKKSLMERIFQESPQEHLLILEEGVTDFWQENFALRVSSDTHFLVRTFTSQLPRNLQVRGLQSC